MRLGMSFLVGFHAGLSKLLEYGLSMSSVTVRWSGASLI